MDWLFQADSWQQAAAILARICIGVVLAAAIGIERELHGRPAGVRTHMLVALGAMLFSEAGRAFGGDQGRVAAQVVTGIGFLGAGSIMRMGGEVTGLTTAASIWATAAIGMLVAAGGPLIIVAVAATLLALITLSVVDDFEARLIRSRRRSGLHIVASTKACLPAVLDYLDSHGVAVKSTKIADTDGKVSLLMDVEPAKKEVLGMPAAIEEVEAASWVH